jgi:hypothetical protein
VCLKETEGKSKWDAAMEHSDSVVIISQPMVAHLPVVLAYVPFSKNLLATLFCDDSAEIKERRHKVKTK